MNSGSYVMNSIDNKWSLLGNLYYFTKDVSMTPWQVKMMILKTMIDGYIMKIISKFFIGNFKS